MATSEGLKTVNIAERLAAIAARASEILDELDGIAQRAESRLAGTDDAEPGAGQDHDQDQADQERISALEAEGAELAAERARLEAQQERRNLVAAAARDLPGVEPATADHAPAGSRNRRVAADPYDGFESRAWSPMPEHRQELRDRAFRAVELTPDYEFTAAAAVGRNGVAESRSKLEFMLRRDRTGHIARLVLATGSEVYKRAWSKAVTGAHWSLTDEERHALSRAMSLTDAAGGFAVPFPIDPTLIVTGDGSTNPVREVARVVNIDTDSWQGVSAAATAFNWTAEQTEVSDDASTFAQPQVTPAKAQGWVPYSIEIGMDYPGLAEDIGLLFAEGKEDLEATGFITGTGTNQPTGIVTALTGTGNEVNSATTDVFAAEDVYTVHETVGPRYRARSSWLSNIAIQNDVRQFGTTDANFTIDMSEPGIQRLMGRRYLEASAMDGVINATLDNRVLVFGDFRNYVIADRAGFNIELVPHTFDVANNRPRGERGWYAWWRTGGDSVNDDAFAMLNVT